MRERFRRLLRREPALGAACPATGVSPVDHDAVREADPYAFEAAHRRLAWMFRLSAMTNVGLIAVVIIETSAIATLVPLQKLELGLVRIEPASDRTMPVDPISRVRVLPITRDAPGYDLMMESFVRRYVRLLLEIDSVSQGDRMRDANLTSDPEWWKRFGKDRAKDIDRAIESGLNRSIVVESADRISHREGVYRYAVDFVQTDKRDGKTVEIRKLRAYVAVAARPHTVRESEKYENPAGFRVLDLALKERGNS